MDYQKIKQTLAERNISIKRFAEERIGMTEAGFHLAMKHNTLKVRDLEKICNELDLKVWYWFEDAMPELTNGNRLQYSQLIKLKEELIRSQAKTIELLEKEVKRLEAEMEKISKDASNIQKEVGENSGDNLN
jgi:DNA-binding Xre family transcriptional regulator